MKKFITTYLSLTLIFSLAFSKTNAKTAILDFSCLNKKSYELNGYWEFYWKKFLTPTELEKQKLVLKPKIIKVPKSWNKINGLYKYGYGTYRIKVIVPKKNKFYALKLSDIFSAYNVWINDSLYYKHGKVASLAKEEIPKRHANTIIFFNKKDTIDILIQISNFNHLKAGMLKSPVLGEAQYISKKLTLQSISVFFMFGGFIILAIYLIWLSWNTKKNKDIFLLGLAVFLSGIQTLCYGEFFTSNILNLSWELLHKISFISNYGKILFLLEFFKILFKNKISYTWNKLITFICILLALLMLIVIITPTRIFSHTLIIFFYLLPFAILYITIGLLKFIKTENNKAFIIPFFGVIILGLFTLNDILHDYQIINSTYLSNLGLFIFLATQSFFISEKQISTIEKADKLSSYLNKLDTIKKSISAASFNSYLPLLRLLRKDFQAKLVMLIMIENNDYIIKAIVDKNREKESKYVVKINSPKNKLLKDLLELSLQSEKSMIIDDKIKLIKFIKKKHNLNFKSILLTRLSANNIKFGIIYLEKEHDYFKNSDKKLLDLISVHIATIINNIKMFTQLQEINKNLLQIVEQRTKKIEQHNQELLIQNLALDERIEELRITAEIISSMNEEIKEYHNILEEKNEQLTKETKSLEKQKNIIAELNRHINESVNYALKIQKAILYANSNLQKKYEYFIISKAKEIVSGNFWWYNQINDFEILAFGQSQYSGIPGAFISLISFSILNQINYDILLHSKFEDIDPDLFETKFLDKIKTLTNDKIYFSTIIFSPLQQKLKTTKKDNFIYLIDKSNVYPLVPNINFQTNNIINFKNNSYLFGFTNNFIKTLINKNRISKTEEITTIVEQIKIIDSTKNIKTFFENYLLDPADLDILIIGIKLS